MDVLMEQDEIQGVICEIDESTVIEVSHRLREFMKRHESHIPVIARSIMRYSVINFRRLDSYVSLVEKLLDFEGFAECFESNVYFGYFIRADELLTKLISLHLLNENKCEGYKKRISGNRDRRLRINAKKNFELAKLIKFDDIDSVQRIKSQLEFETTSIDKISLKLLSYSMHQRCMIHLDCNLIDTAALFGSVRCFKYFLLNGHKLGENSIKFALVGGEAEIIHIIENEGFSVKESDLKYSILNHHWEIFDWIQEKFHPRIMNVDDLNLCFKHEFIHGILAYPISMWNKAKLKKLANIENRKNWSPSYSVHEQLKTMSDIDDIDLLRKKTYEFLKLAFGKWIPEIILPLLSSEAVEAQVFSLLDACSNNHVSLVRYILTLPDIDVNAGSSDVFCEKFDFPLLAASSYHDCEILKMLLERPEINVNQRSECFQFGAALNMAASVGNIEAIKLLLAHKDIKVNSLIKYDTDCGVCLNFYGAFYTYISTALNDAVREGQIEIVKLLLAHPGIQINKSGFENVNYNDIDFVLFILIALLLFQHAKNI